MFQSLVVILHLVAQQCRIVGNGAILVVLSFVHRVCLCLAKQRQLGHIQILFKSVVCAFLVTVVVKELSCIDEIIPHLGYHLHVVLVVLWFYLSFFVRCVVNFVTLSEIVERLVQRAYELSCIAGLILRRFQDFCIENAPVDIACHIVRTCHVLSLTARKCSFNQL